MKCCHTEKLEEAGENLSKQMKLAEELDQRQA